MHDHRAAATDLPALALAELPMLGFRVGLHGSTRHAEVGGQVCFGIAVTIAVHKAG